jgi:hypothetical protein
LCATKQTERKKKKLVHKRTHTPAASLSWSFNSVSQWHLALANTHTHTGFFGLHSRPVVWLSIQAFYMIMSNNFIPPTTPQMPSLKQKVKTGKEKKNENDDLFFSFLPG